MGSVKAEPKPYTGKRRGRKPKVSVQDLTLASIDAAVSSVMEMGIKPFVDRDGGEFYVRFPGKLGVHELTGLSAEAYEAHDYQDERIRFDSLGRKWTFRPGQSGGHSVLELILKHGEDECTRTIGTEKLGTDGSREIVAQTVREMDAA